MEEHDVVQSLAALAQPARLRIYRALVVAGPQGLTPGALAEALAVPPPTLSHHLKELVRAGLAGQERASRNLIYRANFARMDGLIAYLTEHCCQGQACSTTAAATCCGSS